MILLEAKDYNKVIEPLKNVPINTLFAKAVIYGQADGRVYVDDTENPFAFLIAHPYGMSLLFGDTENERFNETLLDYLTNKDMVKSKHEWLQVYPKSWSGKIESLLGGLLVKKDSPEWDAGGKVSDQRCVEYTRVNFAFDRGIYEKNRRQLETPGCKAVRTSPEIYRELQGFVVPQLFWRDEEEFLRDGIGYTLLCEGEPASTAFSAFIMEGQLEIGIETTEKYRGRGFAYHACSALIDHCIQNKLEPVWACRLENQGSYYLAQKLGFVPSRMMPYYQLMV